ncbi:MAG: rod shape-determining protein RodA [Paludibacteraceae bacterium]|nr:rod shape-determining protein RodA [Paludibacteraceae bacterium]
MTQRHVSITNIIDWPTIIVYIILVVAGWFCVYASSYEFDNSSMFDFSQQAGKQLVWIICAGIIGISILLINYRIYSTFAYVFYGAMVLLLIATIFLSRDINGSHSWLEFGPVRLQPAELAKFATSLALAKMMSAYDFKLQGLRNYAKVIMLIMLPMAIIIAQNETGSALVFAALFLVLYRKGMPGVLIIMGLLAAALFIFVIKYESIYLQGENLCNLGMLISAILIIITTNIFIFVFRKDKEMVWNNTKATLGIMLIAVATNFFITVDYIWFVFGIIVYMVLALFWKSIRERRRLYALIALFPIVAVGYCFSADYLFDNALQPHQKSRIHVLLGTEEDSQGAGYNVNQSKIAIGSGQFIGKGYLKGTQTKLKYVPEQSTDFIFCTLGEEFGFVGSTIIMALYLFLMIRIVIIAERQTEVFNQVYAYCVAAILLFHFTINIGMVIGVMPVIGIPLPFFSYGGSSLWGFTFLLFIFLRLDASRILIRS